MSDVKTPSNTENEKDFSAPNYWQSLEEWEKGSEENTNIDNEFVSSPFVEQSEKSWARRDFLKVMGASMALTTFGCVRRPAQKIIPYVNRPEEINPGVANYYSSTFVDGTEGFGVVVKTREGRPIKIEGNPAHPTNSNGLSLRAHGHVLDLYDPDRLHNPVDAAGKKTTFEALDDNVIKGLKTGKVGLLISSQLSPATKSLIGHFKKAYGANVYTWDSIDNSVVRDAQKTCFGDNVLPKYRFDKAKYIVSIDSDFLGTYLSPTEHSRDFMKGRELTKDMNRLVAFESLLTLTGSNADSRIRIKPSDQLNVIMGLLYKVVTEQKRSKYAFNSTVKEILAPYADVPAKLHLDNELFSQIAKDLWDNRRKSIVVAGGMANQTGDAYSTQIAANFLNHILLNDGNTIDSKNEYKGAKGRTNNLNKLVSDINSGSVNSLVMYGVNPSYVKLGDAEFEKAFSKLKLKVYCGDRRDETGVNSSFVATTHHEMENWNDAETQEGVFSIQQPTIRPLYDTRSFQDSLLKWIQGSGKAANYVSDMSSWYDFLKNYWQYNIYNKNKGHKMAAGSFEDFWDRLLQEGVFDISKGRSSWQAARTFSDSALKKITAKTPSAKGDFELVLYQKAAIGDGRYSNIGWLQELPDPVTKITWDNYLVVSPAMAKAKHLEQGDHLSVHVNGKSLIAPVHIQPGVHDQVIGLAIGYGRTGAGRVGNGVGVNAFTLAQYSGNDVQYSALPANIKKEEGSSSLACPQGHHRMEGRQIIIEATLEQYLKNKEANIHRHKMFSLWKKHEYKGHKWALSVDLNKCTGCSACVVACQNENNIPVVGKQYVKEGRIMQWIRIDRYYTGSDADPGVAFMPVMCAHCDNAPCESVCPVSATSHNDEGINEMVYNRCVGTRYCANNCPYKVRRFNWFDYENVDKPKNLVKNPEVSMRARGVMEKCSFCQGRVASAKQKARVESRELKRDEIQTACQQSCPTQALVFGDSNDKESGVSKEFDKLNNYSLLEELNAVPNVRYQTKIRNVAKLNHVDGGKKSKDKGHH